MNEDAQGVAAIAVIQAVAPVRYCLYARKSCEQDELQALSIDSQIKEMTEAAQREGLEIAEVRRESHSAKESGQRPVFQSVVDDIRGGKFNGLIAWDPSRISRNAGDLGRIVDLMDQGLLADIRTHGQRFTNSPNEKFLLMILCSQAKLENDHKGENVKRGLRAKCAQGWRPGVSPVGYVHDKYADKGSKRVLLDSERAPIVKEMFEKVAYEDWSGRRIYDWLVWEKDFRTKNNKRLALSLIYKILKDTYYYGAFEYPAGGGVWYEGQHDPIITKELYLKAQANLQAPPRRHPGTNDFAFTRLLYCGSCGSGICAEEKFKKQKNGTIHRYVYYHCSRGKDRNCKEGAIREEELLKQLLHLIDKIDIDEIGAMEKIQREVARYRKFSYGVLGRETEFDKRPIEADIRSYAKYILAEGTKEDKRALLDCLKSKMELQNRTVLCG
ncbi:MAG: recombinase family protein [Candidatus Colwellbacteria bacterium]|nr:recombinase family protein [Candidatus Colwellbacteria bacterium]